MARNSIKLTTSDRFFYTLNDLLLLFALLIVLYPVVYIVSASFSSPTAVISGKVVLFPVNVTLDGYKAVFEHKGIVRGFANTIFYTVVGTLFNLVMTTLAAYPLSRRKMPGRRIILFLFTFTMLFSGGIVPMYILNSRLGLINTRWVMIIPNAIAVFNMIIMRTFIETNIPEELYESAQIDGCSHFIFLLKIVLPLSKPIIAVLALYYGIGHWNAYFDALLYLKDDRLYPIQLILREILVLNQVDITTTMLDPELLVARQGMADLLKYSLIVVSSAPFMLIYPFVAKHFVKGTLIGAIKG
ncbi:MAG: carbohydrate ABC transporter permease [Clostridiales bacterium]|nr:carbohydrate ABC transporter permease [Clostridiales bacterium]